MFMKVKIKTELKNYGDSKKLVISIIKNEIASLDIE